MFRLRVLGALLIAPLVACQPSAPPVVTESPTPSPRCTPEEGGQEYPCSQADFERMKQRDALYAEAEEIDKRYRAAMEKIYREGAPAELPPELVEITAGSARDDIAKMLADQREDDIVVVGGEIRVAWVKRNVSVSKEGSEVSLSACTDASTARVLLDGRDEAAGDIYVDHTFFKRVDGQMKLWAIDGGVVKSCDQS